jgi:LacI family transcriptional regulator
MTKPTLRTISDATGLALTTVSRALANDPKIAEDTRRRVAQVASDIGYIPDRAAQRLRTGRTNVIALVLSPHVEIIGFRGSMMAGLSDAIQGTRYHVSMTPYDTHTDIMRPIETIVRNRLADGIVFAGTHLRDPRVAYLLSEDFPFVTHGRTLGALAHPWCDYDNARFVELALNRLHSRGRRRVLLFCPSPTLTFSRHMMDALRRRGAELGLSVESPARVTLSSSPAEIGAFVADRMSRPAPPDGIICPGEVLALAVMSTLQDSGRTLGRDVDIVAKQTSAVFDLVRPRIDTIYEDLRAAGATMGRLLLRRIAGEAAADLHHLQAPEPRFRSDEALA